MTWVKICGITNLEDARVAVDAGADAVGFVLYEKSPRKVEVETVREIVAKLPESIEKVGVFVDDEPEQVRHIVSESGITTVQLHGGRALQFVRGDPHSVKESFGVSQIVPVLSGNSLKGDVLAQLPRRDCVFALLLDAQTNGLMGGTGNTFDWHATREMVQMISLQLPLIVAGGLTWVNVAEAMRLLQPFGVDISSGVEARPGKKDAEKIRQFLQAVRTADKTA